MSCPSCGTLYDDEDRCTECGTLALSASEPVEENGFANSFELTPENQPVPGGTRSTLIEFPGVMRSTVPKWRRELSERVREVQERRAREAAQEAVEAERRRLAEEAAAARHKVLLPRASPPLNPLVAAALRRIERANQQSAPVASVNHNPNRLAAVACASDGRSGQILTSAREINRAGENFTPPEEPHGLEVVPLPTKPRAARTESPTPTRRLIKENEAVLDYLSVVPSSLSLDEIQDKRAGMLPRVIAWMIDLVVCALLFSPFAAFIEFTSGDWFEFKTAGLAVGLVTFVTFLYLTFTTALAGRTLGMRILSLRTVDKKTGLIPTGAQSVGRAIFFLASLFALGLPVIYALLHREGHTVHDQLTGTVVVRV